MSGVDPVMVPNRYRAAIVRRRNDLTDEANDLRKLLHDSLTCLAKAWTGGSSGQVTSDLQVLDRKAQAAGDAAMGVFEHAIKGQPMSVQSTSWQARWHG